jgi:YHS domain-containing protein
MKGEKINPNLYADVNGKRIYACCPGCIVKIKAEPEKYIAQLEAEGVMLEEAPAAE